MKKKTYNYEALENFLQTDHNPNDLSKKLDELMSDLVYVSRSEGVFGQTLSDHHYILRALRDIFSGMAKNKV